jgi:catechol 2,3-dioxygenase-like lactoylglutathione lyase family enzyme
MTTTPSTQASFVKLFVRDFQSATQFLGDVLGLPETDRFTADENGRIVHEALFGGSLESPLLAVVAVAYEDGDVPPASNAIVPEVEVADVGSVLERARAGGFRIEERDGTAIVFTKEGHPFAVAASDSSGARASGVTSVRIMVADLDRNLTFATKALGLEPAQRGDDGVVFKGKPGFSIVAGARQGAQEPTGATYVGFIVRDVASAIETTCKLGGHVQRGIKPSGGGPVDVNSAVLIGIEGHRIEVAELV